MKLGIVLPTWLYNEERKQLGAAAFKFLAKTKPLSDETELLLICKQGTMDAYEPFCDDLSQVFRLQVKEDVNLHGTEQTLAFGTTYLFNTLGLDYVTWMGDDALFHSEWLLQLEQLIGRHPDAMSWSVYRSNHERFHAPLEFVGDDVRVRSICGHGLTISQKEWKEWGIKWQDGAWCGGGGDTLDLLHVVMREGPRWVTKKSYVQHTGWRGGVHCIGTEKEWAQEFQFDGK
jgi:hypothetical protein